MRYLSVCSGIEAATAAWHPLGWEPVAFSEIEKFPSAVLSHHYPSVPNWGDMTKFQEWPDACRCVDAGDSWPGRQLRPGSSERRVGECASDSERRQGGNRDRGRGDSAASTFCGVCGGANIDLLVGGTPCQSFSVAGLRKGLADPRGNLALTFLAIADKYRPEWVVWENVPGVLSSNQGRDFGAFLGGLGQLGYGWAYRVLDAQYFGLAQRRRRVFVVASARAGFNPAQVLFEFDGLRRDTPPRRGARTAVAALTANGVGTCGADDNQGQAGHLIPAEGCWWDGGQVSQTLDAVLAKGQTMPEKNRFPAVLQPVAHSSTGAGYWREGIGPLRAREQDSHENLVAFHPTQDPISSTDGSTHAIGCGSSGGQASVGVAYGIRTANTSSNGWGIQEEVTHTLDRAMGQAVAIGFAQNTRNEVRLVGGDGSISGALAAQPGMKQTTYVATCVTGEVTHTLKAEGFDGSEDGTGRGQPIVTHYQEGQYGVAEYPTSGTIRAGRIPEHEMVLNHTEMAVRRLTPRECERLQGFPDDWTLVEWYECCGARFHVSLGKHGCPNCEGDKEARIKSAADGPRYKAIGNSMATPCMAWIGSRIKMVLEWRAEA